MKLDEVHLISHLQDKDPVYIQQELSRLGINLGGIYQELEMSSRFVDTHIDISYGNTPVHLHSHNFYEMVCCQSNSGVQYLVGTKRYRLQRGDVILVPPGIGHRPLFPAELAEPYHRIVLWFSTEFIDGLKYLQPYNQTPYSQAVSLLRTIGTPWEKIVDHFEAGLKEAQEKNAGWQISLCGNTMQLLTLFWRAMESTTEKPMRTEKPELLDNVVSYIEKHLGEPISLELIAKQFYVSESTISQTFQKKMHVSFYHYVTQRRLIAAKSMILDVEHLEDLGHKVGFNDYSSFYRAFKKEFGISPRAYRALVTEIPTLPPPDYE